MKGKLAALAAFVLLAWGAAMAADLSNLVILHTNDSHGFDQMTETEQGMAVVAALKKEYENQGRDVLLVDGGDAIQDNNLVNLSKGRSAIAIMNKAGYDAMTLGNHEFDYGQDVLLQRVREASFPVISANVFVAATGRTLVQPRMMIHKGDVKVGIFGLTTPDTVVSTNPKNVYGLTILNDRALYENAQHEVDLLRKDNCDVVIALGHLGSDPGSSGHRSEDLLQHVNGIDIFIDGHDHKIKNAYVNGTLLAEAGCHTENIGKISHDGGLWREELLPYSAGRRQDEATKAVIDAEAAAVAAALARELGRSEVLLNGNRVPGVRTMETNLGDFVADAVLWQARMADPFGTPVDAALVNGGGLRDSLKSGNITVGDIHAVLPYSNQICTLSLTGETLLEIMEAATAEIPEPMVAFPQIAGLTMTVNTKVPYERGPVYEHSTAYAPRRPGARVTIHEVGGKPFDLKATYRLATFEFICRGGDAYGALTIPGKGTSSIIGYVDTDAVEHYLTEALNGRIDSRYGSPQGRITLL